jgi:uncharacterized protein YbaP (TraB family)
MARFVLILLVVALAPLPSALAWTGKGTFPKHSNDRHSFFRLNAHMQQQTVNNKETNSCNLLNNNHHSSRRQWFSTVCLQLLAPSICNAATATLVKSSPSVCDATVTVWKRDNRILYLLGTAHISELSSNLAGQLVQDTAPNAVFVELDLKRVGGASNISTSNQFILPTTTTAIPTDQRQTNIIIPNVQSSEASIPSSTGAAIKTQQQPQKASGIRASFLDAGAAAVGGAIRNMYKNLDQAGFNPGDEFVTAIREGQKLGADIVLGDQDVQVTLRRLTQALAVTDLKALLSPDSELERSMNELMGPQSSKDNMKESMTQFVEAVKTREKVTEIMRELRKAAPALVQVMLDERNAFMAAGIDSLNQYNVIVAVMGLAHVDGVEENLQDKGWSQVRPKCPA